MGGPDSLAAVEPFLYNLFSDRDIFKIPLGQRLFARLLSSRRTPKVREYYRQIGGYSPLNPWTETQRRMLQEGLRRTVPDIEVFTAMRYWKPEIATVAPAVAARGFETVVLLPLYPHYSTTTTGSAFNAWRRAYPGDPRGVRRIPHFYDHPLYIQAINDRIDQALERFDAAVRPAVQLVFSAHGLPQSVVNRGDPYQEQIEQTVARVMAARTDGRAHRLCYQSRVGPARWLEPSTADTLAQLAADGQRHLLVVPVSFVCDHIETLYELDIQYRATATDLGIKDYVVMEGLNASTTFIAALEAVALEALGRDEHLS